MDECMNACMDGWQHTCTVMPKSPSRQVSSCALNTLLGFTSLCTYPCACTCASPCTPNKPDHSSIHSLTSTHTHARSARQAHSCAVVKGCSLASFRLHHATHDTTAQRTMTPHVPSSVAELHLDVHLRPAPHQSCWRPNTPTQARIHLCP